jgi:hypothetical protein
MSAWCDPSCGGLGKAARWRAVNNTLASCHHSVATGDEYCLIFRAAAVVVCRERSVMSDAPRCHSRNPVNQLKVAQAGHVRNAANAEPGTSRGLLG